MATVKKTTSKKVEPIYCKNGCSDKPKALTNFYKSNLKDYEVYGGYCPTCKACLRKSTIDTTVGMVTMDSIKDALKKVDRPFVEELFNMIKDRNVTNEKFLGDYLSQLNLSRYKECTYSDTLDIQIASEKIMNSKVEMVKKNDITEEMRLFWGRKGLEDQDYIDLQVMFDNFTKNEEQMDFKKESDYKDLCIYQLQKSKMQFDFDSIPKVEKLQKMIDTLSDNLGIQAIQKQQEFDNNKFVLGLIVRYHEDIKKDYIRRWVEDLGNIDPLMDIVTTDFIGGLGGAIGINHEVVEDAKKRMDKYSVVLQEYFDEEDGEIDG